MLNRKYEKEINNWIENGKKALLVSGARQVGKTYIIRHCVNQSKYKLIEFNLIQNPLIINAIKTATNSFDLVTQLSLFTNEKFIPGEVIIFFDEVQEYKEIMTKIKFLVDEGKFKYILSGSLLGIELKNIKSAPVGYVHSFIMYPLDFEEFLQIYSVSDEVIKELKKCFENGTSVLEVIHQKMVEFFNLYLLVGGMPEAIQTFINTRDLNEVMAVHLDIIERYKEDFTKYEETNKKLILRELYNLIPAELTSKNKRFNFKSVSNNFIYDRNKDNFLWLKNAGVAIPVYNTKEPMIPLILNEKSSLFKLFLSDVGLLTTMFGRTAKQKILLSEDINNGAVYENVVAQELLAHGFNLYYYASKKNGEVDFLIEYENKVVPIEVKSGKNYIKHSALNNLLQIDNCKIDESIVFCNDNVTIKNKIKYLPIYMIMFLDNNKPLDIVINFDELKI